MTHRPSSSLSKGARPLSRSRVRPPSNVSKMRGSVAPSAERVLHLRHYAPPKSLSISEVIKRIIQLNESIACFWSNSVGWTPEHAEAQLSSARLDWQVELSRTLRLGIRKPPAGEETALLILGWCNLGTLIEGTLKLYLAVWCDDYVKDKAARMKRGKLVLPQTMMLEDLKQFLAARDLLNPWHSWIGEMQARRNAIHAFRERDIGTRDELKRATREYLDFLRTVNEHLPYPDGGMPSEAGPLRAARRPATRARAQ